MLVEADASWHPGLRSLHGLSLLFHTRANKYAELSFSLQVVKAVWAYIRENELQNPADKRKFVLDDKLKTIFTAPVGRLSNLVIASYPSFGPVFGDMPFNLSKECSGPVDSVSSLYCQ